MRATQFLKRCSVLCLRPGETVRVVPVVRDCALVAAWPWAIVGWVAAGADDVPRSTPVGWWDMTMCYMSPDSRRTNPVHGGHGKQKYISANDVSNVKNSAWLSAGSFTVELGVAGTRVTS